MLIGEVGFGRMKRELNEAVMKRERERERKRHARYRRVSTDSIQCMVCVSVRTTCMVVQQPDQVMHS